MNILCVISKIIGVMSKNYILCLIYCSTFILMYVFLSKLQRISEKNAMNRAKQKYMHHMGPVNFARVRVQLLWYNWVMSHFICLLLFINICSTTNILFLINRVLRRVMEKKSIKLKCSLKLDKVV